LEERAVPLERNVARGELTTGTTTAVPKATSVADWCAAHRTKTARKAPAEARTCLMHCFIAPSAAAVVIRGGSVNGLTAWKTKDGKSLKQLDAQA
jgi:Tfp pilus assembly protein PilW